MYVRCTAYFSYIGENARGRAQGHRRVQWSAWFDADF
eukprot:COSAG05_NODE_24470_length_251_cov_0.684211_2_plen_36_part_01